MRNDAVARHLGAGQVEVCPGQPASPQHAQCRPANGPVPDKPRRTVWNEVKEMFASLAER